MSLPLCSCQTTHPPHTSPPLVTAENVNPDRLSGIWYEIATIPNAHEAPCYCSSYAFKWTNSHFDINKTCWSGDNNGRLQSQKIKASPIHGSKYTKYRVRFSLLRRRTYEVIYLDQNYRYALLGSIDHKYLWVLSYTADIDDVIYRQLIKKAKALGYPTDQLQLTDQSC